MKKVLLIHGYGGMPNGAWRPWLMRQLAMSDISKYCFAMSMPSPNKPKSQEWISEIANQVIKNPKDKFVLVGHSLGVPAILSFLQQYEPQNVLGSVLVSGPYKSEKKDLKDFFDKPWDFKKINKYSKKITVIHGDDDKIVKFEHAEFLTKNLSCNLIKIKNGGHLNLESGFDKLPQALKVIQNYLE